MLKKDLLEDIQIRIEQCNQHINLNPYPPALKRVGYVLNNKCRTLNVPFYLNAIYNELQLKINTNTELRMKHIYTADPDLFTLADVDDLSITLKLNDIITTTKQRRTPGKKSFLGKKSLDIWTDVVSSTASISDSEGVLYLLQQKWKKVTNNSVDLPCENIQEALKEYNERNYKSYQNKQVTYEELSKDERLCSYHEYSFSGVINVTNFVHKRIQTIIDNETRKNKMLKEQNALQLYNWDFFGWEVFVDSRLQGSFKIDLDDEPNQEDEEEITQNTYWGSQSILIPTTNILDKLNKTKSNTTEMKILLNKNKTIHNLIDSFDEKYFDPYYESYQEYNKKYGASRDDTEKRTQAFKECKKLLDKMFIIILGYESLAPVNESLAGFIEKYNKFKSTYNLNQNRKTVTPVEDTLSHKKLRSLWALRQQILDSGNAKLQEYYREKLEQYANEVADSVIQLRKDIEYNNKKQNEFVYLLDSLNLRYNGVQTAFKEHLRSILEANQKKAMLLNELYQKNLFQDSDIKIKIVVKFIPDCIPSYFQYEVLDKSFVYEDLQNKIKDIVEGLNEQKKNEVYYNTVGKTEYEQHQRELKEITDKLEELRNENLVIEKTLTFKEAAVQQLQTEHPIALEQALLQDPYLKTGYYYSVDNAYNEKISSVWEEITTLQNQYNGNNMDIAMMSQQLSILILQCRAYSENSVPYTEQSAKYKIYDEKEEVKRSLALIESQMQEVEAIRKAQTQLNQDIITTNQNYIEANTNCLQKIIDLEKKISEGADFNDPEVFQLKNEIDYYDSLRAQYSSQLKAQKEKYLDNNNLLKSTKDFKSRRDADAKELEEIEKQIAALESPAVEQEIAIDENGVAYEKGYNFSTNGLYKNLYIDTQKENEWITLKQDLLKLYSYYNFNLEDGLIQQPETTSAELTKCYPKENKETGEIELFEDNNENCKCNWFIPMDYLLFGPGYELPIKLTTKVYKTDRKGNKIPTYDKQGKFVDYQILRRLMAVQNGYGYIFTGLRVTLMYTGLPGPEPISIFISGVGLDYGAVLAGGYVAITPYNIFLMKKYPYQNTMPGGQFYWLQTGLISDIYQTVMGKLPIEVTFKIYKKIPLPCGYPKKCGVLKPEEYAARGKCGLRLFFEDTHDIFTDFDEKSFDIGEFMKEVLGAVLDLTDGILGGALSKVKEAAIEGAKGKLGDAVKKASSDLLSNISDLTRFADDKFEKVMSVYLKNFGPIGGRAAQLMLTKRNIALWGNTSLSLATNTWNVTDALNNLDMTRKGITEKVQGVVDQMKGSLIDLIPPECQDSICNTMREAKQDSIKDLGMSVNLNTNLSVETLSNFINKSVSDTCHDMKDKASKIADGISNIGNVITGAVANLFDTNVFDFFSLTQYCPRRLADVTKDINPLKQEPQQLPDGTWDVPLNPDIFTQMGSLISLLIIGNVMGALNNCVTRSITNNNINYSSLFPEGTRKYLESTNEVGDIANMAKGIGGYNMSLENLFHEGNRSSILANFADIDTGNISLGYLTDFLNERGVKDIINVDEFLSSNETIDVLQSTLNQAVSNNLDVMLKLKNGEILTMNDQYKQLVGDNLNEKTQLWSKGISDTVNTVTSVGENVKGLLNQNFDQAWKNPHQVTNKLQNITNTMNNMMMKIQARDKKRNDLIVLAFSESEEVQEMKRYLTLRWEYLEKLTKQDYAKLKEEVNKLSVNI